MQNTTVFQIGDFVMENIRNIEAEIRASKLADSCRATLEELYEQGHDPESALFEALRIVPLDTIITRQCAFAIMYLEMHRRVVSGEVPDYVTQ